MTTGGTYIYGSRPPVLVAIYRGEGWSQPVCGDREYRTPDLFYEVLAIGEEGETVYECRVCDALTGEMILEKPQRCRSLEEVATWWEQTSPISG